MGSSPSRILLRGSSRGYIRGAMRAAGNDMVWLIHNERSSGLTPSCVVHTKWTKDSIGVNHLKDERVEDAMKVWGIQRMNKCGVFSYSLSEHSLSLSLSLSMRAL